MSSFFSSSRVGPAPAAVPGPTGPAKKAKLSDYDDRAQGSSPVELLVSGCVGSHFKRLRESTPQGAQEALERMRSFVEEEGVGELFIDGSGEVFLPGAVSETLFSVSVQNPIIGMPEDDQGDSGVHSGNPNTGIRGNEPLEEHIERIEEGIEGVVGRGRLNVRAAAMGLSNGNAGEALDTMSIPSIQSLSGAAVAVATRVFRLVRNHCPHPSMPACVTNCIERHPVAWARSKQLSKWAAVFIVSTVIGKKVLF